MIKFCFSPSQVLIFRYMNWHTKDIDAGKRRIRAQSLRLVFAKLSLRCRIALPEMSIVLPENSNTMIYTDINIS